MLGLCEAYSQDLGGGEAHLREALELAGERRAVRRAAL